MEGNMPESPFENQEVDTALEYLGEQLSLGLEDIKTQSILSDMWNDTKEGIRL